MNFLLSLLLLFSFFLAPFAQAASKFPDLTPQDGVAITRALLEAHASHKHVTPELMRRTLASFLEELDPTKLYFTEQEIAPWLSPSDEELKKLVLDVERGDFSLFEKIKGVLKEAIERRKALEKEISAEKSAPSTKDFSEKESWPKDSLELKERLSWLSQEIAKTLEKLEPSAREKGALRIEKRRAHFEEEIASLDERLTLTAFLKAFASSLDTHTAYFTPAEAAQFMVQVQQRLFGIGVQLRDDLNGFTVVKILEGSPATLLLAEEDRVIAINDEPTIGMEIADGVELIRGEEGTEVELTVVRKEEKGEEERELKLKITRGEIVLKEARIESTEIPFGEGVIAHIALHAFYQDNNCSSASDLYEEIQKIRSKRKLEGVVLDLRNNSGVFCPKRLLSLASLSRAASSSLSRIALRRWTT